MKSQGITRFACNHLEDRFFQWCSSAASSSKLSGLVDPRLCLIKQPGIGYEFIASENIPQSSLLINIPPQLWEPFSATRSVERVRSQYSSLFQRVEGIGSRLFTTHKERRANFLEASSMALNLMLQLDEDHPYVSLLAGNSFPFNPDLAPHPLLREDISALEGVFLCDLIRIRQQLYRSVATQLFPSLVAEQEAFLWAISVILSRGVSGEKLPFSLIPLFDLVNHGSARAINSEKRFDLSTGCFQLWTSRDVAREEAIRFSYGSARENNSFMTLYGFLGHTQSQEIREKDWFTLRLVPERGESFEFLRRSESKRLFLDFAASLSARKNNNTNTTTSSSHKTRLFLQNQQIYLSHPIFSFDSCSNSYTNCYSNSDNRTSSGNNNSREAAKSFLETLSLSIEGIDLLSRGLSPPSLAIDSNHNSSGRRGKTRAYLERHVQAILTAEKQALYQLRRRRSYTSTTINSNSSNAGDNISNSSDARGSLDYLRDCLKQLQHISSASGDTEDYWRSSCALILQMELLPVYQLLSLLQETEDL